MSDFPTWVRFERGLAEKTVREYTYKVNRAAKALDLVTATCPELRMWLLTQKDSSRTRNQIRCALACYMDYLVESGIREDNPARQLKRAKERRGLPRPLPASAAGQLLERAARYSPMFGTLVAVFLYTGLRLREVTNWEWDWIEGNFVYLTAKRGQQRAVYLCPTVARALHKWNRRCPSERYVFPSPTYGDRPVTGTWVYKKIRDFGKELGLPNVHTHRLRHTFATSLLRQTGRIELVQKALGHTSIQNTVIYAEVVQDGVAKAVAKLRY